jgi:hypothetical protein
MTNEMTNDQAPMTNRKRDIWSFVIGASFVIPATAGRLCFVIRH